SSPPLSSSCSSCCSFLLSICLSSPLRFSSCRVVVTSHPFPCSLCLSFFLCCSHSEPLSFFPTSPSLSPSLSLSLSVSLSLSPLSPTLPLVQMLTILLCD